MIELINLSYTYPDSGSSALTNISLCIRPGELLAVVGHNGSGKSTLAKHLNALLLPTAGQVLVDGMDTRDEANTIPIRQRVGMLFQNPDNQLVTTIVEEDVGFGPENLGIPPKEIRTRVDAALKEVGMTEYAQKACYTLSGGQKQRVAIAGLLAMAPEVLILDEATAMLDPSGREEVLGTVRRLNKEKGITVVMITQYMEETVKADRVAVMAKGLLIMEGTPREVFAERGMLREHGLDAPAYVQLRDELAANGVPIAGDTLTDEELAGEICQLYLNH